jgi:protein-S-isoprenylcysteine O-methyltransferase Ste14
MSKYQDHLDRKDLVGEHRFGDAGQLIFLIIFMVVWVLDSFILDYSAFAAKYVSLFIRIPAAVVFLICAGYLTEEGMRIVFGEKREAPVMVNESVFSLVRHPIYLGSILFYVGLVIATLSLLAAIIAVVIITFYHYLAKYEERLLLLKFGDTYAHYMRSVPMWVPRLRLKTN